MAARVGVQNFPCSLGFNGTSTYVVSGGNLADSGTGTTHAFWIKTSNAGVQMTLTDHNSAATGNFVELETTGALRWQCGFATTNFNMNGTSGGTKIFPCDGRWHFVVATMDYTSFIGTTYIDGVLWQTQTAGSGAPSTKTLFYATSLASASRFLKGSALGFMVFNRALAAYEVIALMNGQIPSNLTLNWPLTEGAGTTAFDISGNANNGTITAGTYTIDVPSTTRQLVGENMVKNGGFEFAPPTNVAQTNQFQWYDGTSGGSSTNRNFGWQLNSLTGSGSILFDAANAHNRAYGLKVSTTATASKTRAATAGFNSLVGSILCSPSTSYILTFWMKTTANSGAATTGAHMPLWGVNGAGTKVSDYAGITGIATTTSWTQYTYTFTTGSSDFALTPYPEVVGNDGTATLIMDAYYDQIELRPTVNTTRTNVTSRNAVTTVRSLV